MKTIAVLITLVLVLLGIVKKQSKLLLTIQWIWIWIIQGFNCGGMDYQTNELIYNYGGNEVEWLTYLVIKISQNFGIDYMWYRLFWVSISILIIYKILQNYSMYPCLVMFPYVFFLMTDNTVQCRFFWAYCLVLLSYHFSIKGRIFLQFVMLVVASGVHTSAFVFMLFPLIQRFTKRNSFLKNNIIILLEVVLFPNLNKILNRIGLSYASIKLNAYLNDDNYSSITIGIVFMMMYLLLIIMANYVLKRRENDNPCVEYCIELNNSSFFVLPMLLFNSNFGRFIRPVLLFDFISLSDSIYRFKKESLSRQLIVGTLCLASIVGVVLQSRAGWFAINTLFENNYLLTLIGM